MTPLLTKTLAGALIAVDAVVSQSSQVHEPVVSSSSSAGQAHAAVHTYSKQLHGTERQTKLPSIRWTSHQQTEMQSDKPPCSAKTIPHDFS